MFSYLVKFETISRWNLKLNFETISHLKLRTATDFRYMKTYLQKKPLKTDYEKKKTSVEIL